MSAREREAEEDAMSQPTARQGPQPKSEDDDEVTEPRARRPGRQPGVRPRRPLSQPSDDDGAGPDGPDDDGEFELAGGDDLGPADLGPLAPHAADPDAASGRIRKIRPDRG
jgi:hypothetical protein